MSTFIIPEDARSGKQRAEIGAAPCRMLDGQNAKLPAAAIVKKIQNQLDRS
jgi:hypothetical protein